MAQYSEKYLTPTDISRRLSVPVQWLGMLPPFEEGVHEVQFEVIDGIGFYWEFCCSIRRIGPYPKPVLQAEGWLRFVNHKKLKVDDKVILDLKVVDDFRGIQLRLRAQKLNSEGHWVDV